MTLSYSFSGIPGMYGVPSTNRTTLQTQTPLSSYCTLMKHNTNAIHNMTSASQEEKKREGKKRLKRRIHSCTRERERGSSLISYFPALACPHKQLSPPSQVKTEVHRDPDYQEPAELIGKQTQSYQNPFVSWVCK